MSTAWDRNLGADRAAARLWWSSAAWLALVLAVGAGLVSVRLLVPWSVGVQLIAIAAWFVTPGVLMIGRGYGWDRAGTAWLMAPGAGYLLSSLALLLLWVAGMQSWPALMLAPVIAVPAAWAAGGVARGHVAAPALGRRDIAWLGAVTLLVPLIVGWPYARVGETTSLGAHYRAYFTADFVWAMAAVAEVSKGAVPPVNPFRTAGPMHYYWLAHLFPAAEHRWLQEAVALRHVLLVNALLSGMVFVAWLYGFARTFVTRAWPAAAGVGVAILATSFEGLQQVVELWWLGAPMGHYLRSMNIDSVTRWVFHGMPIDGLQRLLLYQPQHQLGYATALSALLLVHHSRRVDSARTGLMVGAALAGSFLLSTFSALMATVAVALFIGYRLLRERTLARAWVVALFAAVPLFAAVLLTRVLQDVDTTGHASLATIGLNPVAARHWILDFALGMGPLVLAAAAAAAAVAWRREAMRGTAGLWLLLLTCLGFYFFVDVRDHQDVYVGWRAGHLMFIAMAAIVARLMDIGQGAPRGVRRAALGAAALVVAAALPTSVIDLYNTQDIWNLGETAAGRWTLVLSGDEMAALAWIKANTVPEAVVQVDPVARDPATWAYIPAFAERRMAAGLPISMVPLAPYQEATRRVVGLYRAPTPQDVAEQCLRHGIDYLLVGPPERQAHPDFQGLIDSAPELLAPMFRSETVSIYHVEGARR